MSIGKVWKGILILCLVSSYAVSQNLPKWSYEGATGPEHWADLSPEYAACKAGKEQSPVDIRRVTSASLPAIRFDYRSAPLKLINNGHTVQANYGSGSSITIAEDRYELKQFHFHRPSEERIDGKPSEMVLHLVHSDTNGKLAVVSILLRKGAANAAIQTIFSAIPKPDNQEREIGGAQINASDFLPPTVAYYTYRGSLTTPPCTEGVTWFILKDPATISATEIQAFAAMFPENARPIQPLGERTVKRSQ